MESVGRIVVLDDLFVLRHVILGKDNDAANSLSSLTELFHVANRDPLCVLMTALKAQ